MKSFSQFLEESYLNEGVAPGERRPARRRKPSKSVEQLKADIDARDAEKAARRAQRGPTGAAADSKFKFKPQGKTTTVKSPASAPQSSRPALPPSPKGDPSATRGTNPQTPPESMMRGAYDAATKSNKPSSSASSSTPKPRTTAYRNVGVGKETVKVPTSQPSTSGTSRREFTPDREAEIRRERAAAKKAREAAYDAKKTSSALATRSSSALSNQAKPASSAIVPAGKPPTGPKIKVPSGLSKAGKVAGKILGPAAAALDVADEKAKGSGWARSLAKGAAVAAGGALGGAAGSVAGPAGSIGGSVAGSMAASKAFDVAAGANAKERKAMATANRQRQAGTAIKGIGGPTSFDTKKNTMTTGSGSQRKTVGLAKTGVVQRGGQSTAGHLAYKGGKAVYKAGPSAQSLAKTSSNPLERIGRSLFAGAYKQHDAAKAKQALAKARQSDAARNKALGVKALPGK